MVRETGNQAVIQADELYPTSPVAPDPKQVAQGVIDLSALDAAKADSNARVKLAAECTNCAPGSVEAQQFNDLVVEVRAPDGQVYKGPLAELNAEIVDPDKAVVKVWLADTGKPQAQGVLTQFAFTATQDE